MGRIKLAIKHFDRALKVSPKNLDALLNKGAALHSEGSHSEAILCYDAALKIDKKCAVALAYKGLSLGEMNQLEDAVIHFKKAVLIDREYDLAHVSKEIAQELLKSIKEKKAKTP